MFNQVPVLVEMFLYLMRQPIDLMILGWSIYRTTDTYVLGAVSADAYIDVLQS